jgi:glycosyltransferase involved in cell wall biosynthesis
VRVAEVCHYYLPHIGGIELYVHRVARDLIASGDECRIFSSKASGFAPGEPVTYLPSLLPRNPPLLGLRRALAEFRPDVVHAQSIWFWPSVQAARAKEKLGYRIVNSVHGVWPDDSQFAVGAFVRLFQPLAQYVLDRSDLVIVYNAVERERILRRFKVDPGRIFEVAMGADAVAAPPAALAEVRRRYGRFILFTGRIIPDKNAHVLAEAFSRLALDGLKLVFVGPADATYRSRLLLARNVIVEEPIDPVSGGERLAALYAAAEVSVVIGSWEGLPTRVIESLAQSTPVVAYASGGMSGLLRDGDNALLTEAIEPAAVAQALRRWFAMAEADKAEMRRRARASAQDYLWPAKFAQIRAVLRQAASLRPQG